MIGRVELGPPEEITVLSPVTDKTIEAVLAHEEKCWDFILEMEMHHSGSPVDHERWQAAHDLVKAVTEYLRRPDLMVPPRILPIKGERN